MNARHWAIAAVSEQALKLSWLEERGLLCDVVRDIIRRAPNGYFAPGPADPAAVAAALIGDVIAVSHEHQPQLPWLVDAETIARLFTNLPYPTRRALLRKLARMTIDGAAPINRNDVRCAPARKDIAENLIADIRSLVLPINMGGASSAATCADDPDAERPRDASPPESGPRRREAFKRAEPNG
jgi:hypothetical protein